MSPPSLTPRPEHDRPRRSTSPEIDRGASGRTWRQWFVPSRVTSAFFVFNTVFWGFMIVARYEFAVFAQVDRENLLGWAVWRGCFGWLLCGLVHLICSRPWLANRSWQIRLVVGVGIASLLSLGIALLLPLLPASPQSLRMIVTWLWCGLYFGLEANDNQSRAEFETAENVSRAARAERFDRRAR